MINDSSKQTTYRRIIYVKEVQKEILRLTGQANESIDDELRTMLYYLNYNSIRSFAYHTQLIADLVDSAETHVQKIESLSLQLKKINQAQVKPSVGYNYLAPSLKSQLSNYIIEEIDYLQKLQTLGSDPPAGVVVRKENELRIDFNLSVAQLALFIKTLLECKVIQNQNTTELLKLLARIAVTKKTDWISYDSLRAKFYNVESSTKATVRQLFLDFAAYIERHSLLAQRTTVCLPRERKLLSFCQVGQIPAR